MTEAREPQRPSLRSRDTLTALVWLRWLVASCALPRQLETASLAAMRGGNPLTEPCNEYQFLFEGQPSCSLRDFDLVREEEGGGAGWWLTTDRADTASMLGIVTYARPRERVDGIAVNR